jgi:hypothetical protein
MRLVQHIKRSCSRDVFNAHLSGERCLELKANSLDIEIGDLITFVEVDEQGDKTGRNFSRKVIQVELSSNLGASSEEIVRYGVAALGLQAPEFNTLRLAFNKRFLFGIVIECNDGEWKPLGHEQCWPLLIAPDLAGSGVLQHLKLEKWPTGIYTIHLMLIHQAVEDHLEIDIDNALVLAFCNNPPGDDRVDGVEVELNSLMVGKAIGSFDGALWTPTDPAQVKQYFQLPRRRESSESSITLISGELDENEFREVLERKKSESEE